MYRASAYDVFAPSVLNSAAGMSAANPASRRSSFRATAQEPNMYKENSPSPEKNDASLFVEEDRRMRRRGSQLYVVHPFHWPMSISIQPILQLYTIFRASFFIHTQAGY